MECLLVGNLFQWDYFYCNMRNKHTKILTRERGAQCLSACPALALVYQARPSMQHAPVAFLCPSGKPRHPVCASARSRGARTASRVPIPHITRAALVHRDVCHQPPALLVHRVAHAFLHCQQARHCALHPGCFGEFRCIRVRRQDLGYMIHPR
jgi:hypothetical protein